MTIPKRTSLSFHHDICSPPCICAHLLNPLSLPCSYSRPTPPLATRSQNTHLLKDIAPEIVSFFLFDDSLQCSNVSLSRTFCKSSLYYNSSVAIYLSLISFRAKPFERVSILSSPISLLPFFLEHTLIRLSPGPL